MRETTDMHRQLERIPHFFWRPGGAINAAFNYVAGYYEERLDYPLDDEQAGAITKFLIDQGFDSQQVYRVVETYRSWREFKAKCLKLQLDGHKEDFLVDVNALLASNLMSAWRLAVMEPVWDLLLQDNVPVSPVNSHPDLESILDRSSLVSVETAKSEQIIGDHRTLLLIAAPGDQAQLHKELSSFIPASGRLALTGGWPGEVWYPGIMLVDVHTVDGKPVFIERGVICSGETLQW